MPIYFMFVLSMPRKVRLRIKQIQRDFFMGGGALEQKPHLVRSGLVCLDKSKGVLGVVEYNVFIVYYLSLLI